MSQSYWKDKTVIVTGGTGFIGSHFVEGLLGEGANVICLYHKLKDIATPVKHKNLRLIQIDLLDLMELQAVCRYAAKHVDVLVHCAALDGNTEFKLKNAARILDTNMRITSNILNSARENEINDVVLLSSAEIYSPSAVSPIAEEDDYKKQLGYTENGYVLSKTFSEVLAELHRKQFGMSIYLPRPTNVYGPRDNFNDFTNRVIPSIMKKVAGSQDIDIWGDGTQTRSFIYVKDLVRGVLQMVEKGNHKVVNFATKESISIIDLAKLISDLFQQPEHIHLDPAKPIGVKSRELDVRKFYETIDFVPCSLRAGLEETVQWYKTQLLTGTAHKCIKKGGAQ